MSCEEELRAIAVTLKKESVYFSGGWNINMLQAFIRDGGCCVYCGTPLLEAYGVSATATGDHLLPRHRYPHLAENVDNLVPACSECNRVKHYYDPSEGKGGGIAITEDVRLGFISKSKEEIQRKRIEYEQEFILTGKIAFKEAVMQYRKCKESKDTCLP
jgi:hypothetical protein